MIYRTKPEFISAIQYEGKGNFVGIKGNVPDWIWAALESGVLMATDGGDPLTINTMKGPIPVLPQDWIVQNPAGEISCCKPDIFHKTYDPV